MTANELQYTSLTYTDAETGRAKTRWFLNAAEAYGWVTKALWPAEAATAVVA